MQTYHDLLDYGVFSEDETAGRAPTEPELSQLLFHVTREPARVQQTCQFWDTYKNGIYRKARGWAGIAKMAKEVGMTFEYIFVYRRASSLLHGSPVSSSAHYNVTAEGFLEPGARAD